MSSQRFMSLFLGCLPRRNQFGARTMLTRPIRSSFLKTEQSSATELAGAEVCLE